MWFSFWLPKSNQPSKNTTRPKSTQPLGSPLGPRGPRLILGHCVRLHLRLRFFPMPVAKLPHHGAPGAASPGAGKSSPRPKGPNRWVWKSNIRCNPKMQHWEMGNNGSKPVLEFHPYGPYPINRLMGTPATGGRGAKTIPTSLTMTQMGSKMIHGSPSLQNRGSSQARSSQNVVPNMALKGTTMTPGPRLS